MTWYLFDYAGVISLPPPPTAALELARQAGTGRDRFWDAYWEFRKPYDLGHVDARSYWGDVYARLGRQLAGGEVDRLVELDLGAWFHLNEDTLAVLDELHTSGQRLALFSNAPVEMARLIDAQHWAGIFRHRYFSADLHLAKPDLRSFRKVCAGLGAAPEEVVFVDDREENVTAADQLGMRAVLFRDALTLRSAIADLGPSPTGQNRKTG